MAEFKYKDVFTIIDSQNGGKPFWLKIGISTPNRDGSWNVTLNALPINGKLQIREPSDFNKTKAPESAEAEETPEAKKTVKKAPAKAPSLFADSSMPKAEDDSPF